MIVHEKETQEIMGVNRIALCVFRVPKGHGLVRRLQMPRSMFIIKLTVIVISTELTHIQAACLSQQREDKQTTFQFGRRYLYWLGCHKTLTGTHMLPTQDLYLPACFETDKSWTIDECASNMLFEWLLKWLIKLGIRVNLLSNIQSATNPLS